jgi:hypothetical protein
MTCLQRRRHMHPGDAYAAPNGVNDGWLERILAA